MRCVKVKVEMREIERHFPFWDVAGGTRCSKVPRAAFPLSLMPGNWLAFCSLYVRLLSPREVTIEVLTLINNYGIIMPKLCQRPRTRSRRLQSRFRRLDLFKGSLR